MAGVIAAIGVIVTLLYLSRQVQQNTEQARAQVAHGIMTALREQADAVKQSSDTAENYYRGLRQLESLSDGERFQFNAINVGFFRVFEEAYLHHRAGRLEDAYWNSLSGQLKMVLQIPGIREDWSSMGDNFDSNFRGYVGSLSGQSG